MSNSQTKFGLISSNGLGGDGITDRRTVGGDYNIPFAFLKKRGDKYGLTMWMKSSVASDKLASSEASWSRWTLFLKEASSIEFCKQLCLQ